MDTGLITPQLKIKERMRLAELSLLLAVLKIDPGEFLFISREAQGGYQGDIETTRSQTSIHSSRTEHVISAFLPSFKNHFPDDFFAEELEESPYVAGVMEDKTLEFWSAFDTTTYRFWITFHLLKLRMLLYSEDTDTELLFWARFGEETPVVGSEERKGLLLFRFYAAFFRGRRLLYERVLPAFIKHRVSVAENLESTKYVPRQYQNRLGQMNSLLGRDLYPGETFSERHSLFRINVHDLDSDSVREFAPGGRRRVLLDELMTLFTPAYLQWCSRFQFRSGQKTFLLGERVGLAYLGLSTFLKATV